MLEVGFEHGGRRSGRNLSQPVDIKSGAQLGSFSRRWNECFAVVSSCMNLIAI